MRVYVYEASFSSTYTRQMPVPVNARSYLPGCQNEQLVVSAVVRNSTLTGAPMFTLAATEVTTSDPEYVHTFCVGAVNAMFRPVTTCNPFRRRVAGS